MLMLTSLNAGSAPHVPNRWYDPTIGRWLSEDPVGYLGDRSNLGRYASNSPTSRVDPSGMKDLGDYILEGASGTHYILGDQHRNLDFWRDGGDSWLIVTADDKGNQLGTDKILAAIRDLANNRAAYDEKRNEMYCNKAAQGALIHGFIKYYDAQPEPLRRQGLDWIAEQIVTAGGDIDAAAPRFFEDIQGSLPGGLDPGMVRPGDQVHFVNPAFKGRPQGDDGRNLFAAGKDKFFATGCNSAITDTADEIQKGIFGWPSAQGLPNPGAVVIDRIRRPRLPRLPK